MLIDTPYEDLSEEDKWGDRREADRVLALLSDDGMVTVRRDDMDMAIAALALVEDEMSGYPAASKSAVTRRRFKALLLPEAKGHSAICQAERIQRGE